MPNLLNIYMNPNKYAVQLPIEKIIADNKIHKQGVNRYKTIIKSGGTVKSIIVVKHPKKEYYAVLDGHHRYWAFKELKYKEISCAIIKDYIGLGFYITKEGGFQPDPKITKYIRIPVKQLTQFMNEFIKDPEKLFKKEE